jgi:CheY-like chemotaxis protein
LGLQGNLEDLPLLDIVQIVSFSKKTGYLAIQMGEGQGAIVFRNGLVVSAFTGDSPPIDPGLSALPGAKRERAVRHRIIVALERLARLREGIFGFELTDEVPGAIGEREIAGETLVEGINPQQMLLDLAEGIDEDRARSTDAVEASFATVEEAADTGPIVPIVPAAAFGADMDAADSEPPADPFEPPPGYPGADARTIPPPMRPGTDTQPIRPVRRMAPPPASPPPASPPSASPPSASPPPASPAPASPAPAPPAPVPVPPPVRTVLLVDDEEDVREILARHFAGAGFGVETAGDPDSALKTAARLRSEAVPFVLVTDLGMPASGGASFHGGFEVVKRLWKMNLRPPVLMMTENLSQSLRLRARQMGVQSFVFKPTLSKLNPPQFEADLAAFAGKLARQVLPRLSEEALKATRPQPKRSPKPERKEREAGPPAEDATHPFAFLKRRLQELRQGGDASQIAVLVMKVAREFFERGILFVVRSEEARGLGGFGLAPRDETLGLLAREISIPLRDPSLFRDVARERRPFYGAPPQDRWLGTLLGRIGRFHSGGIALVPLVAHRETIALLFGDNPETGREVSGMEAIEVFVQQAGIALENVFLQRKLQSLEEKGEAGPG